VRVNEIVSLVYFGSLVALARSGWIEQTSAGRLKATLLAAMGAAVPVLAASPLLASMPWLRDWAPLLCLPLGYWAPAALVRGPRPMFEKWLWRTEVRAWQHIEPVVARTPRWLLAWFELAYLMVYPFVPLGFSIVYSMGSPTDVDRFWTAVLATEYICYGLLPLLPSRPPRMLTPQGNDGPLPTANAWFLGRFAHGWNTFPSGHAAGAMATALSVAAAVPAAGFPMLLVATSIAIGTMTGRYHYVADTVAGVALALVVVGIGG
jgi:membrane-associated phospholipid phosphatase